jgi:hypothetical protein
MVAGYDLRVQFSQENFDMKRDEKLADLRNLETKAAAIRRELAISPPGVGIFSAQWDAGDDESVIVEADGFGGATTRIVAGNYPVDFIVKFEKFFISEEEAIAAAERIAFEGASPDEILALPS